MRLNKTGMYQMYAKCGGIRTRSSAGCDESPADLTGQSIIQATSHGGSNRLPRGADRSAPRNGEFKMEEQPVVGSS